MAKTPDRSEHTGTREGDSAQRAGRDAVKRLNAAIFDGGVLLDAEPGQPAGSGLAFVGGTARSIPHGLGKRARGWLEVYGPSAPSAACVRLFATATPAAIASTHVTVTPTSTGIAFLFVF